MIRLLVLFLGISSIAIGALAQENPVRMIADRIEIAADGDLVASGDIEVFYGAETLIATLIRYDVETETLAIDGPILFTDENGDTITAQFAELDRELKTGLLMSARVMLENQLELQADKMLRIDGVNAEMQGVAATSCITCDTRPPLWQIRASAVRHDTEKRTVHFKSAQLLIGEVPILYLPRLRIPDPSLKRSAGFLVPSLRSTSRLGTGIVTPYFLPIGTDKDLTFSPYISPNTRTLQVRYRQVVSNGKFQFDGSISDDNLNTSSLRAFGRVSGDLNIKNGYKLGFKVQSVSDDAYVGDYEIDTSQAMDSNITIERTRPNQFQEISLSNYQSFYKNEGPNPFLTSFGQIDQRLKIARLGGTLDVRSEFWGAVRSSGTDKIGRDIARINSGARYHRNWDLMLGSQMSLEHESRLDHFFIDNDSDFDTQNTRLTHTSALTLRWPFIGRAATSMQLIEPIYQIANVEQTNIFTLPSEESTRSEFDEGNLIALSRFAAPDRIENGRRSAIGLNYNFQGAAGYEAGLTMGQINWHDKNAGYSNSSGLSGSVSDVLLAAYVETPLGFNLQLRTLIGEEGRPGKSEVLSKFKYKKYGFDGRYSFLPADPLQEDRDADIAEWTINQTYAAGQNWQLSNSLRYDLVADSLATAGIGIKWDGQCSSVVFSADRRFTDLGGSPPQTTYGFSIALKGFSTGGASRAVQTSCGASK